MWQTALIIYIVGGMMTFPICLILLEDDRISLAGIWVLCLGWPVWLVLILARATVSGSRELWSMWKRQTTGRGRAK